LPLKQLAGRKTQPGLGRLNDNEADVGGRLQYFVVAKPILSVCLLYNRLWPVSLTSLTLLNHKFRFPLVVQYGFS
ncbi:MAG: hypothetical protein ACRERD_33555, partial [Candidatus Binatia bacterium]